MAKKLHVPSQSVISQLRTWGGNYNEAYSHAKTTPFCPTVQSHPHELKKVYRPDERKLQLSLHRAHEAGAFILSPHFIKWNTVTNCMKKSPPHLNIYLFQTSSARKVPFWRLTLKVEADRGVGTKRSSGERKVLMHVTPPPRSLQATIFVGTRFQSFATYARRLEPDIRELVQSPGTELIDSPDVQLPVVRPWIAQQATRNSPDLDVSVFQILLIDIEWHTLILTFPSVCSQWLLALIRRAVLYWPVTQEDLLTSLKLHCNGHLSRQDHDCFGVVWSILPEIGYLSASQKARHRDMQISRQSNRRHCQRRIFLSWQIYNSSQKGFKWCCFNLNKVRLPNCLKNGHWSSFGARMAFICRIEYCAVGYCASDVFTVHWAPSILYKLVEALVYQIKHTTNVHDPCSDS